MVHMRRVVCQNTQYNPPYLYAMCIYVSSIRACVEPYQSLCIPAQIFSTTIYIPQLTIGQTGCLRPGTTESSSILAISYQRRRLSGFFTNLWNSLCLVKILFRKTLCQYNNLCWNMFDIHIIPIFCFSFESS